MKKYDLAVIGGGFAGVAIALAVRDLCSVREIDIAELRRVLKSNNAFI